jgi:hypothetical protein
MYRAEKWDGKTPVGMNAAGVIQFEADRRKVTPYVVYSDNIVWDLVFPDDVKARFEVVRDLTDEEAVNYYMKQKDAHAAEHNRAVEMLNGGMQKMLLQLAAKVNKLEKEVQKLKELQK